MHFDTCESDRIRQVRQACFDAIKAIKSDPCFAGATVRGGTYLVTLENKDVDLRIDIYPYSIHLPDDTIYSSVYANVTTTKNGSGYDLTKEDLPGISFDRLGRPSAYRLDNALTAADIFNFARDVYTASKLACVKIASEEIQKILGELEYQLKD